MQTEQTPDPKKVLAEKLRKSYRPNLKIQLLIPILILGVGIFFTVSKHKFINKCELVKAKITDVKFVKGGEDENDLYILALFIPSKNSSISGLEFDTGFTDPEFKVGQVIDLYYDSKNPADSEIKNLWEQWAVPIILGLALIAELIFVFIFFTVFTRFRGKTERDAIISE